MNRPVHSITDAPLKHSVEQRGRMVRYSIAMGTRIACFVAAAVVGLVWESWWAMVLAAAAMVLPYVAVVGANAGGDRYMAARQGVQQQQRVLGRGHEEPESKQWWDDEPEQRSSSSEVIEGVVVQDPGKDQQAQERRS